MIKKWQVSFDAVLIVSGQAIIISSIYLYSQINKWSIREELTGFLMPFYTLFVMGFMIISTIISASYFIIQIIDIRKIYIAIPIFINIISLVVGIQFFNEGKLREYNFKRYEEQRERIVGLILEGELKVNEKGEIVLPKEWQNKEIERNGYVRLIDYSSGTGIYFCTYTGLLETSSGYIFFTRELINQPVTGETIVILDDMEDDWYYCSTN